MGIRAVRASTRLGEQTLLEDRDVARLVVLLQGDRVHTLAELRERGIQAPAQAIYTLQLGGYPIERVAAGHANGGKTTGYRLPVPASPPHTREPEAMRTDPSHSAQAGPASQVTIRVQRTLRGRWEVVIPGRRRGITCETLDDARRLAYLAVAHTSPCELIVQDPYHRVVHHELIAGHQPASYGPPRPGKQPERKPAAPRISRARPGVGRHWRHQRAAAKQSTTRQGGQ